MVKKRKSNAKSECYITIVNESFCESNLAWRNFVGCFCFVCILGLVVIMSAHLEAYDRSVPCDNIDGRYRIDGATGCYVKSHRIYDDGRGLVYFNSILATLSLFIFVFLSGSRVMAKRSVEKEIYKATGRRVKWI